MPPKNTQLVSTLRTVLVFFGLWICVSSYAEESFTFSPINGLNGLSDKGVRSLSQLPDGRMVVITEGLVHLYDGATFHYMHYDERKAYPLSGYTGYHHLYTDKEGQLWIKNTHTLFLFDTRTESFVPELDAYWKKMGINDPVADFFIDSKQGMWLLTRSDKLLYREAGTSAFRTLVSNTSLKTRQSDALYDVAVVDNQAYLFYRSGWIIRLNLEDGQENARFTAFPQRTNPYMNTLMVVPFKQYLYQVRNSGQKGLLNRFNTKTRTWETLMETDYWLNTLTIDAQGDCWMSSHVGLWKIDHQTLQKRLVSPLKLVDGTSLETEISAQYTDNQGGLWVGTFNRGLLYYHPEKWLFSHFKGLPSATCFAELGKTVLVGTVKGLFELSDGGSLLRFPGIPASIDCNALLNDSRHRVWLSTERDGVFEISGRRVRQHPLPFACRYLFETASGHLYLCGEQGFGLFDPSTGRFLRLETVDKAGLGSVFQLVPFGKKALLGLSTKGLFQYDLQTGKISFPSTGSKPFFVHPNRQYNCLLADSRGRIWFGTQDGLNVYNPTLKTAHIFHREDGLSGNAIKGLAEEASGVIWITTSNGISCISTVETEDDESFYFNTFDRNQGVSDKEFNPHSIFITSDQQLFFGLPDGFNALAINRDAREKKSVVRPLFTKLTVSGVEINTGVANTSTLTLEHDQEDFTLECSALNYIHPDQPFFRYRLKGHDKEWQVQHPKDGICRIHYADLHPGTYQLTVYASNNPRTFEAAGTGLTIVVKPSVFGTPLALVVYVLLLSLASWFVYSLFRKRQSKAINVQASSVKARTEIILDVPTVISSDDVLLQKVLGFIKKNLDNPSYSVEQLSKDMAMDRTNLYRKLSAAVGMTPSEFIRSVRLKYAVELLEKGYRVSEVAGEVGFGTTSYFSKCFQEYYGVSPSQFRKLKREGSSED